MNKKKYLKKLLKKHPLPRGGTAPKTWVMENGEIMEYQIRHFSNVDMTDEEAINTFRAGILPFGDGGLRPHVLQFKASIYLIAKRNLDISDIEKRYKEMTNRKLKFKNILKRTIKY